MMEYLKVLLLPSNIAAVGMLLGIVFCVFQRTRWLSMRAFLVASCVYAAFSSGIAAAILLSPLEYQYPYVQRASAYPGVRSIVMLTSSAAVDPLVAPSSRVDSHTAFRILEVRRLYSDCPSCRIIVSGSGTAPAIAKALLLEAGISSSEIEVESVSLHTDESAKNLEALLEGNPFFLVTSAGHMARAVGVFRKLGMVPVPAPTDYLMPKNVFSANPHTRIQHLYFADLAVGEYAAMLWYKIRGRM